MSLCRHPKRPRGLTLLGHDPAKGTYHWEGPDIGTIWETLPHQLYGWLKPWTGVEDEEKPKRRTDWKPNHYLMDPHTQVCYVDPLDDEWAWVVDKCDCKLLLTIRRECLFAFKPSLIGSVERLENVTSSYAFAGAIGGRDY
jgi:hypothetical protein